MRKLPLIAVLLLLALTASSVYAQTLTIPRYTVIPVTLETTLSSATNRVGDTFNTRCSLPNCGGFPPGTTFTGRITEVIPASRGVPGQLGVNFFRATFPDGTSTNISGNLTSLNQNDVDVDPSTGRIVQEPEERNQRKKFASYGAGTGAVIGAVSSHKQTKGALQGALIGGMTGWVAGSATDPKQVYNDVVLPPGTDFGITLQNAVSITSPSRGAGSGAGPGGSTIVTYGTITPFTNQQGILLVPLRETMTALNTPFSYRSDTDTVTINSPRGTVTHAIGTRVAYVSRSPVTLNAQSTLIVGTTFVPVDLVTVVTGRQTSWNASNNTLTLQ